MLQGKFAQTAEFISIVLILLGIVALCQPFSFWVFQNGFALLLLGWIGLTVFSHRKPVQ
jgi:uncharacterized membrane protein YecN with MAPEG domain